MTLKRAMGPATRELSTVKAAVVVMAVILTGFAFWALRHILTPFMLAVFLLLMVDGLARVLQDRIKGFPKKAALPTAIVLIVALFAFAIWMIADNASDFLAQSHDYAARLNILLEQGSRKLGLAVTPTVDQLIHRLNPASYAGKIAGALKLTGEQAVFVLIYLGFLIASRQGFARKTAELFNDPAEMAEANRVFERVRKGVESYIWVQTIVGLIIGAASAALMYAMGLQHVLFWTFIIFLANYIPAIGAAVGVLFPPVFALVQFPELWKPITLLVGMEAIHFGVSHVLQPRMQGKNLNLDPLVVLLALAFWGAIWGLTGAFLSTPLTVIAMAILAEFKGGRPIAVLLSSDGKPYAGDAR
ncbi:AI-2E family transporter [Caulobacter sp. S45]|uniref:AI-2E family transporter n=1 Tax=Caulobacter sp. S45 TaxID=1641861 RepID=UPI0020B169CA|nr:AI-2E family transporter [Caulobacter sp. S45]